MLYLSDSDITQKEIAKRVQSTEQSVCTWIKAEGWDKMREAQRLTKGEMITKFTQQMLNLQKMIEGREEASRYPSSKEADVLLKLQKAISQAIYMPHSQYIDIGIEFINHVRRIAPDLTITVSDLFDAFMRSKLNGR